MVCTFDVPVQLKNCLLLLESRIKAFFESHSKYCSLIWIFHSKASNNKRILRGIAHRIICNDQTLSFEELRKHNFFSFHNFYIQSFATVLFKVSNNIFPAIIDYFFTRSQYSYKLRSKSNFAAPDTRTVLSIMVNILYGITVPL